MVLRGLAAVPTVQDGSPHGRRVHQPLAVLPALRHEREDAEPGSENRSNGEPDRSADVGPPLVAGLADTPPPTAVGRPGAADPRGVTAPQERTHSG